MINFKGWAKKFSVGKKFLPTPFDLKLTQNKVGNVQNPYPNKEPKPISDSVHKALLNLCMAAEDPAERDRRLNMLKDVLQRVK